MDRWSGKVALVTGGSSGIGAEICRALVKHGMTVVTCARRVDNMRAMALEDDVQAGPGKLIPIQVDLRQESQILSLFQEIRRTHGRLDLCVNNAGLSIDSPLLSAPTFEWKEMLDVNVLALSICTREAVKIMRETGVDDGQIIHISSFGSYKIMDINCAGLRFYAATKYMVRALTEGLRSELKASKSQIRTACVSACLVKTEFLDKFYKGNLAISAQVYDMFKPVEAKDICDSVLYILGTPPHVEVHDILVRPRALNTF